MKMNESSIFFFSDFGTNSPKWMKERMHKVYLVNGSTHGYLNIGSGRFGNNFWLTQTLQVQLQRLSDLLQKTKPQWFAASGLRYQRREQRRIEHKGSETDLHL